MGHNLMSILAVLVVVALVVFFWFGVRTTTTVRFVPLPATLYTGKKMVMPAEDNVSHLAECISIPDDALPEVFFRLDNETGVGLSLETFRKVGRLSEAEDARFRHVIGRWYDLSEEEKVRTLDSILPTVTRILKEHTAELRRSAREELIEKQPKGGDE